MTMLVALAAAAVGASWSQLGQTQSGGPDEVLGDEISMSSDGTVLVVGGDVDKPYLYSWADPDWADDGYPFSVSVHCYVAISGDGSQIAAIEDGSAILRNVTRTSWSSTAATTYFPTCSVDANDDGTVIVGGLCDTGSNGEIAIVRRGGHATPTTITNSDLFSSGYGGPYTVSVSAGSTVNDIYVAVGAPAANGGQGAAFVYHHSPLVGAFQEMGQQGTDTIVDILAANAIGGASGMSVSLVGDDNSMRLAVGSPEAEDTSVNVVGRVDLFHVTNSNAIITTMYGDVAGDKFGTSVALSEDDDQNTLVVGAPQTATGNGYVKVYRYVKVYQGSGYLELGDGGPGGTANGGAFGTAVAISGNGYRIAVGAPGHGNGEVTAWEYVTTTTTPTMTPTTTTTTTTTAATCVDVILPDGSHWVDSHNEPCDWYRETVYLPMNQLHCNENGIMPTVHIAFPNKGHTAGTACCACGGGVSSVNFFVTPVGSAIAGNSDTGIGSAVSLSNDGNTVVSGGRGNGGSFRVFTWSGSWQQHSLVKLGDGPSGHSVAISGDGNRFVVTDDANGSGRISTYGLLTTPDLYGQMWTDPDTVDTLTGTGCSAAFTTDGSRLAVGACFSNPKVLLYSNDGTQWGAATELEGGGPGSSLFGYSVAIAETGTDAVVAVGAPGDVDGKVYLFLAADNANPKQVSPQTDILANERFGHSVSLSRDGSVLAVGSPLYGDFVRPGAVRIFEVTYGAEWSETTAMHVRTLFGDDGDEFGTSVSLSPDGNTLFVGAPGADEDAGYVAVYDGTNAWIRVETVDGDPDSRFGTSVSATDFTTDGTIRFAAGAPGGTNSPGQIRMYDIGTAEPSSDDSGTSAPNLGAIIGGSVGGVALIAAAVYFLRGRGNGEGSPYWEMLTDESAGTTADTNVQ